MLYSIYLIICCLQVSLLFYINLDQIKFQILNTISSIFRVVNDCELTFIRILCISHVALQTFGLYLEYAISKNSTNIVF